MSQIANITVFDGAPTPVVHTLKAIEVTKEKGIVRALWREENASVPVYAQIRATTTLERLKSGVYKTEARVAVPVMESVSGQNAAGYTAAPKVAYEDTFVAIGFTHERSTIAGRRLARQILVNLLGNVSTTVAAATSGPVPELMDNLVAPT
ncbi:TPA_asm: coat protein [ssRNA phage SRR7976299_10]|uniref:Coat protein n=1 Tax=ssRNA phage SRR7976299_10 TaxID=2786632 RepID=A0A8S5L5Q1_9VIRU|nr:coat protein [ssRNA phage SRR7976299_10]DAD52642.1 TPA_asm: coat protein [ssRNA phage SRR7976299_10]